MKRCIHIDFHTMPGIDNFAENISAKKTAQMLKDANVTYVNMFARCNVGFSYYPTKAGFVYPGLKRDLLGEMIEEMHKVNIGISAYLNVGVNHELVLRRPELLQIDEKGRVYGDSPCGNNFFRSPCLNSEYRQLLYAEIREIAAKNPDGIFCDCMIPKRCYCKNCLDKMHEAGIDVNDDKQVYRFAFENMLEVAREIRSIVPDNMKLYLNSFPYDLVEGLSTHAELECLPTDTEIWGYDFFTTNAPYYRMFSDERVYMTGRFVKSWGDYGGYRNIVSIENDVFDALLYGFSPSVGDHMDPVNGLDEELYKGIGKIFDKVKKLEKWTDNAKPLVEAAIVRNKTDYEDRFYNPNKNSGSGAAKMLSDLKICFDIVNEEMDFSKYRLIIVPGNIVMNEALKEKLNSFNGAVLSCGKSLDTNGRWSFIDECSDDENKDGFYERDGRNVAMYALGVKMKSKCSISDYIEPYFDRCWDGYHAYFYVPPKESAGYSAIAKSGNTVHFCFDVFRAYFENDADYLRDTVLDMIDDILPDRLIEANNIPITSRATLMRSSTDILQIKTTFPQLWHKTGKISEHITLPAGRKVSVKGEYKNVFTIPNEEPLEAEIINGRTVITLPEINGYIAIKLQ